MPDDVASANALRSVLDHLTVQRGAPATFLDQYDAG